MSRKDKQADLRRRMAEARSKLLLSQHPLLDDEEGSEEVGDNNVAGTRKRPLSPGGGSGGILRKSKYSTKTDSAAKQSSSSSHQNSLGALVDGYGESSSDDDDDDNRNSNRVVPSANTVTISTAPHQSQSTAKKNESKHNYKPDDGNNLNKSGSISKPASTKEDTSVSDEVWDEFNAMLEADEAATNDVINTTATTKRSEETPSATKSKEDDNDNEKSPTSHNAEVDQLNIVKKINKDDLYDNDDTNIMEQTSYEARLARLILLKNKKKKKKQTREMNEVASASTNLPSAGDFYDPSLAWADVDEQEEDGEEVEKQINSEIDRDDEGEVGKTSLKQTTAMSLSSSAAVSMAKILRGRREEARMLASRGEGVANDGDLSQDMDASDGKWF